MTADAKRVIHDAARLQRGGLFQLVGGVFRMVTATLSLCAIAYYAFTEQWLAAIFFLLARQQLLKWLDAVLIWVDRKGGAAEAKLADAQKLAYSPVDESL